MLSKGGFRLGLTLVCLGTSSALHGQLPPLAPQAQVVTLRNEWNVAMTQKDTARLGRLLTDDAAFLSVGVRLNGRDEVTGAFGRLFDSFPGFRLVFTVDTLVPARPVVTDSSVSEYGTWQETFNTPGGTVVQRGTYYDVWRREPAGWRIAVHAFTRTSCLGNPRYCQGR